MARVGGKHEIEQIAGVTGLPSWPRLGRLPDDPPLTAAPVEEIPEKS
jgi:hypothetical protein